VQTDDTPGSGSGPGTAAHAHGADLDLRGRTRPIPTRFTTTRPIAAAPGPDEFLKEFHGYLQADAYSGYDGIYKETARGITEVACMAHARRKYFEAQSLRHYAVDGGQWLTSTCVYDVEREARGGNWTPRNAWRCARSGRDRSLNDMHAYLKRERDACCRESDWQGHRLHVVELGGAGAILRRRRSGDRTTMAPSAGLRGVRWAAATGPSIS